MNDIDHQMSKKVDKQGQYLLFAFPKVAKLHLYKGENKVGVKELELFMLCKKEDIN